VGRVSRTAERNPAGMKRLSGRLSKVQPEILKQFDELTDQVAQRAVQPPVQPTDYQNAPQGQPYGVPSPPR